jgi:hypothetical protein
MRVGVSTFVPVAGQAAAHARVENHGRPEFFPRDKSNNMRLRFVPDRGILRACRSRLPQSS